MARTARITCNGCQLNDEWRELVRLARRRGYQEVSRTFHTRTAQGQLWKHRETRLTWLYGGKPIGHPFVIRASYPVA